jgi:hypothetical protein
VTLPAAGWFPDPQDAARLRWWDGRVWGDGTRPAPGVLVAPAAPAVVVPSGPAFSVAADAVVAEDRTWAYGDRTQRFCVFAFLSVLAAVVSFALNPWGLTSAAGILLGVVALVHPGATERWRVVGQSVGASALVLAVATGAVAMNAHLHLF